MNESPAAGETGHKVFSRPFRTYRNRRQLYLSCYRLHEPHYGLHEGSAGKMLRTDQDAAGLGRAAGRAQDQRVG